MCLYVRKICDPMEQGVEISKYLKVRRGALKTPFTDILVPFGDGFYKPTQPARVLVRGMDVHAGYLHASARDRLSYGVDFTVPSAKAMCTGYYLHDLDYLELYGIAYDVAAYDGDDLICGLLYLPQLDVRNYSPWDLAILQRKLPRSFTKHTKEVMGILGLGPIPNKPQAPKTPKVETDYSPVA